ncbi:MAG TPA: hypothetical protein VJ764_05195 [Steroidobacteraceae bacterium]|nr:hypothetical protein [Steroidobacteraceae bacterium]
MTSLLALWLPIVVSAVIVFIASSIIHMGPFWHRGDYPKVPNEDRLRDAMRPLNIPPGEYMVPRVSSSKEMQAPEFQEKLKQGPVLVMTVMPNGMMSMTSNLVQWFLYCVLVSFFAAYVASRALPGGEEYLRVFQLVGATAFVGYTLALYQMSIWYKRSWSLTIKATVDGLIYALLTGGTFGWLWPH